LMYALVFVLGFMVSRMMGGRLIEGTGNHPKCMDNTDCDKYCNENYDNTHQPKLSGYVPQCTSKGKGTCNRGWAISHPDIPGICN
jgi:hypothetical protein